MKRLSKAKFSAIEKYILNEARPLEKAIFNYYFKQSNGKEILNALQEFHNHDGGFGRGIEPDFSLWESSPMATSIGLRYLSLVDHHDNAKDMISKAIQYLEYTYDKNRHGWYSVPSSVNNYPHAPWWSFIEDRQMTVIDYSWGNPTAELIGYLYKYKEYLSVLNIDELIKYAINNLNDRKEFKSEHEIYCYIRMYNNLKKEMSEIIQSKLKDAIWQLININESEWINYVPTPLKFIEIDSEYFFGIDSENIDRNLDYLVDEFENENIIRPNWKWDNYNEEWENAKKEWSGILTLEGLLNLLKFNRIEK